MVFELLRDIWYLRVAYELMFYNHHIVIQIIVDVFRCFSALNNYVVYLVSWISSL